MDTSAPYHSERGNVLIIEDDNDTAETLVIILAHAGYGVRKVTNRADALNAIQANLYQCILMDFHMPGLSAQDFLKELKKVLPNVNVVLLTASRDVSADATRLGLRFFIGKPFDLNDLLKVIASACNG
jgi:DNA-binding NtrC family response regulator